MELRHSKIHSVPIAGALQECAYIVIRALLATSPLGRRTAMRKKASK
jgi:hypothetical protein